MAPIDSVRHFKFASRYRIDDQTRSRLAETWPAIAPHLNRVIDEVVVAVMELPNIGRAVAQTRTWSNGSNWRISKLCWAGNSINAMPNRADKRFSRRLTKRSVEEISSIARTIGKLTTVSTSIAAAV
jgi:hypothetical protein